ncbi:MAG: STAS domain-containing protein [Oscillospiraceae bacterium]|nr:STAS domain-containing protein [Oscillospiraceae bacterium]
MAVTGTEEGRVLTLAITGEIDHHQAGALMRELDRQIDSCLPKQLMVDLSGVTFMDSSGIAVLLRLYRQIRALDGAICVQHVPDQAARVLNAAGLDKLMPFQ